MKKLIPLLLFIFLLLPTLLAIEIKMNTNFSSGETLIAEIPGNFLEKITSQDVSFYRNHVKIPTNFEVGEISDSYYIYTNLPQPTELTNYSISIDVKYLDGTKVIEEEIKKNFTISEQKADFSVSPGFIKTEENFSLIIQNVKGIEVEVSVNKEDETKGFFSSLFGSSEKENSVTLSPGEIEELFFKLEDFEQGLSTIKLSSNNTSYEVPVLIPSIKLEEEIEEEIGEDITISPEIKQEAEEKNVEVIDIIKCERKGGTICPTDKICDGTEEVDEEGKGMCCIGICKEKQRTSAWKFFGILIIIAVIIIIFWFFTKYRKTKKGFNLLDIARGGN